MSFKTKAISNTVNFKIGEEFEEKNAGGKVVKVNNNKPRISIQPPIFLAIIWLFPQGLATFEDNILVIITQTEKGEIQRKLEFTETGITMVRPVVTGFFLFKLFLFPFFRQCSWYQKMLARRENLKDHNNK